MGKFCGRTWGIGDLLVGFSFFSLFQLIEVILAYIFRFVQGHLAKTYDEKEIRQSKSFVTLNEVVLTVESERQAIKSRKTEILAEDESAYGLSDV